MRFVRRNIQRRTRRLREWRRLHLRPGNDAGVSLIEVLISVIVLGIVVVPIFDSFVVGRTLTSHRGERRMALRLVERKVEQLMNAGYGAAGSDATVGSTNLTPGTHPTDSSIVVNTRGDADATNDVIGSLTWTVDLVAWSSPGDSVRAKSVEVRLRWPAQSPRDSVSVTTLIGA
jgi:prepilin-type N-terminal cleavage/methylation domain-containing protein